MPTLLVLMMSILLTACSSAAAVKNVQNSPLPPTAMLESTAEEAICYTAELETWEDASFAEDGTPLVSYSYTLPTLRAAREDGTVIEHAETPAEEQALAMAAAFNDRFSTWVTTEDFEGLTQEAQADLDWRRAEQMEWTSGYVLELDCSVYQTEHLISVFGVYYSHIDGAAHPNTWMMAWNFDLEEGTFFEPPLLGEGQDLQAAVTEEIIRQAGEPAQDGTIPAEAYWEDYREIAANWSTAAVSFDQEGMVVTFSPYELAAYALGPQTFRFSYRWMEPHLSSHAREILELESP